VSQSQKSPRDLIAWREHVAARIFKDRSLTRLDKAGGRFHDHYKYKHMEETVGDDTSIGRNSTMDRERGLRRSVGSAAPRSWTKPIQIPSWLNKTWSTSN
jgi:hypothetical protein